MGTDYTAEQIAAAARLVGAKQVTFLRHAGRRETRWTTPTSNDWQPWADTEAGSADWAVLDTAVLAWVYLAQEPTRDLFEAHAQAIIDAAISGDLNKRKAATFAAAAAIGAHMKGVEG